MSPLSITKLVQEIHYRCMNPKITHVRVKMDLGSISPNISQTKPTEELIHLVALTSGTQVILAICARQETHNKRSSSKTRPTTKGPSSKTMELGFCSSRRRRRPMTQTIGFFPSSANKDDGEDGFWTASHSIDKARLLLR